MDSNLSTVVSRPFYLHAHGLAVAYTEAELLEQIRALDSVYRFRLQMAYLQPDKQLPANLSAQEAAELSSENVDGHLLYKQTRIPAMIHLPFLMAEPLIRVEASRGDRAVMELSSRKGPVTLQMVASHGFWSVESPSEFFLERQLQRVAPDHAIAAWLARGGDS